MVGSHSGLVRLLGEQIGPKGSPGFKSLSHRQFINSLRVRLPAESSLAGVGGNPCPTANLYIHKI